MGNTWGEDWEPPATSLPHVSSTEGFLGSRCHHSPQLRRTWSHTRHYFLLRKPLVHVGKCAKRISPSFRDRKCSPEIMSNFLLPKTISPWRILLLQKWKSLLPPLYFGSAPNMPAPLCTPHSCPGAEPLCLLLHQLSAASLLLFHKEHYQRDKRSMFTCQWPHRHYFRGSCGPFQRREDPRHRNLHFGSAQSRAASSALFYLGGGDSPRAGTEGMGGLRNPQEHQRIKRGMRQHPSRRGWEAHVNVSQFPTCIFIFSFTFLLCECFLALTFSQWCYKWAVWLSAKTWEFQSIGFHPLLTRLMSCRICKMGIFTPSTSWGEEDSEKRLTQPTYTLCIYTLRTHLWNTANKDFANQFWQGKWRT